MTFLRCGVERGREIPPFAAASLYLTHHGLVVQNPSPCPHGLPTNLLAAWSHFVCTVNTCTGVACWDFHLCWSKSVGRADGVVESSQVPLFSQSSPVIVIIIIIARNQSRNLRDQPKLFSTKINISIPCRLATRFGNVATSTSLTSARARIGDIHPCADVVATC